MNKWTIMFLISAENNLINESIKAIEEIYRGGSSKEVSFLIIFDGLEYGKFSKRFARPSLYEVTAENGFFIEKPVYVHKSDNLSSTSALIKFLSFIKRKYPAENYGFFYKGHGGSGQTDVGSGFYIEKLFKIDKKIASKEDGIDKYIEKRLSEDFEYEGVYEYRGYAKNKTNSNYVMAILNRSKTTRFLSYRGVAYCIKKVFRQKIAFVCLDCCWGQQIENAYIFSDVAQYFVASADESPALGIGYQEFCSKVNQRPNIKPEEIANLIVAVYFYRNYSDYDSPIAEFRKMGVSITNVKTSMLAKDKFNAGKNFEEKMRALCDYMIQHMGKFAMTIFMARKKCKDYTYKDTDALDPVDIIYPVFNIDLPWLLSNLRYYNRETDADLDKMISELLLLIETEVIHSFLGSNYRKPILGSRSAYTGGNGLSILFPVSKLQAEGCDSLYQRTSHPFYVNCQWLNFLKSYYRALEKIRRSTAYKNKIWPAYNTQKYSASFFGAESTKFKSAPNQEEFAYNRFKEQVSKEMENETDWEGFRKKRKKQKR